MERMLSEYLEFARGEGGEAAEATELAGLVAEATADSARSHEAADRIALKIGEPVTVAVKRNAFKRCLVNLIDNGLKYGGRVEVGVGRTGRSVELTVDDDGPGIPSERREEAFRPFHRLDEGRNLQTGGVGLGLAIARDIARAHGGDVTLQASPLGGLRALIRLPL
jgi:two-component system osmolarity sensor histidine kinase EnvZ